MNGCSLRSRLAATMGVNNKNPTGTGNRINFDQFRDDFSSSAFKATKTSDGIRRRIVGKFVDIEVLSRENPEVSSVDLEPIFDIWIVRPDREPISRRKLNSLISKIRALPEYSRAKKPQITILNGEAYLRTTYAPLVREIGFTTEIRRRKRYSEATRQARRGQLALFDDMRGDE
jgi:hypothetical protein